MIKIFLPLLFLAVLFPTNVSALENELITEDFSSDLSKWRIVNDSHLPPCSDDSWSIENGRLVARMVAPCTSNLLPILNTWDKSITKFTIEMDMWFISGKDHNLLYRYYDFETDDFGFDGHTRLSEFHFNPNGENLIPTKINLAGIPESTTKTYYAITPNKLDPYKMRLEFEPGNVKLYIDEIPTINHTYTSGIGSFPPSEFGIRAGSGIGLSETHFDNIRVTQEVDALDVPYFSQLNPEWASDPYDSSPGDISDFGCTLTSAVMLLRYHGIDTIPGTSDAVTPLTLNNWLINNNGYDLNGFLSFAELSKLTKAVILENPEGYDFDSLEVNYLDALSGGLSDYINTTIKSDSRPLILKMIMPQSPSGNHFTVVRGVLSENEKYITLDPLDENSDVTNIPPNEIVSAIDLIPSNTNLSYLMLHTNEPLRISVENPNGKVNSEIDLSRYGLELPIINYLHTDKILSGKYWSFEQKYPTPGEYIATLDVDINGFYDVWLASYDIEGEKYLYSERLYLKAGSPSTILLTNDPDDSGNTTAEFIPGYQIGCDDMPGIVDHLFEDGHIKSGGVHKMLSLYSKRCRWMNKLSSRHFEIINRYMKKRIEKLNVRYIDDFAKEFLLETMVE